MPRECFVMCISLQNLWGAILFIVRVKNSAKLTAFSALDSFAGVGSHLFWHYNNATPRISLLSSM